MTGSSGRGDGTDGTGNSWEQRAASLASEVQRRLIRASARNMRDELGDQVRKAFRGQEADPGDVWGTATTESPRSANEAPECAWCPVCRAARRIADARSGASGGTSSVLSDAADAMTSAVKEVLAGLDSVLSYRPGDAAPPPPPRPAAQPAGSADEPEDDQAKGPEDDQAKGPEHGPDHRS